MRRWLVIAVALLLAGCAGPSAPSGPPPLGWEDLLEDLNRRKCGSLSGDLYRVQRCDGKRTWRCVLPGEAVPTPPVCQ